MAILRNRFCLAAISQLTLIALGVVGVALAFIYLNLSKQGGNGGAELRLLTVVIS